MAIEKLSIIDVVGKRQDVDSFIRDVYLFNNIEIIEVLNEIESGRFTLPIDESNLDELLGFEDLETGGNRDIQKELKELIREFQNYYHNELVINYDLIKNDQLDTDKTIEEARTFIDNLNEQSKKLNFNEDMLEVNKRSLTAYSYLKDIDVSMRDLDNLEHFTYYIGTFTQDNVLRLKLMYESIPSIIYHLGDTPENEAVYLILTANEFKVETDRVLQALDFKKLTGFNQAYYGTPDEIIKFLEEKNNALLRENEILRAVENDILERSKERAIVLYNMLNILLSVNLIKMSVVFSKNYFYFSGWIPDRLIEEFTKSVKRYPDLKILIKNDNNTQSPTKFRNNWFIRPFEDIVKMYGIPEYGSLDPTPFLSITYILFFGYMFGDVGQGLVLLLGGYYLERSRGSNLGAVISRVGIASIIFGFLYGSVFGIETLIPTLWIKPMENTTQLLLTAVIVGVVALIIAYIYGLIDKQRAHQTEQEYFGKNGFSGFFIYLLILVLALMMYNYLPTNPIIETIIIIVIVLLTLLVFLAEPIMNIINKKKFSSNVEGSYYISSFFEVFEMYLSMLSNTLSFIRVGAFALTHVGMFMAFETIAEMVGGGVAGAVVLIIGNIFIIGLEGLIDYIQCLRLEFYELFGKYFEGNGVEFVTVQEKIKLLDSTL